MPAIRSLAATLAACALLAAGPEAARASCKPTKHYAVSAKSCLKRVDAHGKSCCESAKNVEPHAKMAALWDASNWIVSQEWWRQGVQDILNAFPDMTLNHVAGMGFYSSNEHAGLLPSTAQVCLRYGSVGGAGKDDITKGIGYYHFNRVSVGNMCQAPNFPLVHGKVQYFIHPSVLLDRHFIVCEGNIALSSCMTDKLESRMANNHAKLEEMGRRSLDKLKRLMDAGMPLSNEIAIFGGVPFDQVCDVVTLDPADGEKMRTVTCDQPRSENNCKAWVENSAEGYRFAGKASKLIRGQ